MISVDIVERVATVTMRRPPVNALNVEMVDGLNAALDAVDADGSVGCILVRSEGTKSFCAGADIRFIAGCIEGTDGVDEMITFVRSLQDVFDRIESHPVPSVSALDGSATGGGLELALACDLRVAGEDARIGLPETGIGLLPGAGGTQRLTRVAGRGVASLLILSARLVTGAEAREMGVVHHAVPRAQVGTVARELAAAVAALPTAAVSHSKACIALAPSREGFEREIEATRALLGNEETAVRVKKFLSARRARSAD